MGWAKKKVASVEPPVRWYMHSRNASQPVGMGEKVLVSVPSVAMKSFRRHLP